MKNRTLLALALVASASASLAALPPLTHVKRIDLIPYLNGTNALLSTSQPSDLAIDGSTGTVYVATQRNLAGAGDAGVLKVADSLGTATVSLFTKVSGAAGSDRESRITFYNGSVYWAYGLGETINTLADGSYDPTDIASGMLTSGVRKYSSSGTQDTNFGNVDPKDVQQGVLNPVEIRNNQTGGVIDSNQAQRTEAMDLDPLTNQLGFLNRGSGFLFRINPTNGLNSASISFSATASTGWRDLSFDEVGNAYFKNDNQLWYASRTDATHMSAYTKFLNVGYKPFSSYTKVEYVPAIDTYSSSLYFNTRDTLGGVNQLWLGQTDVAGNPSSAAGWDSSSGDPTNRQPDNKFFGNELIGSTTPNAWTNPLITARYAQIGGRHYLFVLLGGGGQQLDIYELNAPAGTTVSGVLDLNGYVGTDPLTFQVSVRDGASVVDQQSVTVQPDGSYSFTTTASGTKDIYFDGSHWLNKLVTGVALSGTATVNASLLNGDIDGDNFVTIFDYLDLSNAFDSTLGDGNFNAEADLDGDLTVTIFDYVLLSDNFDRSGDD
ncbi:MAG: hypothetical protein JST40_07945 [Armatimonadetes bacterium]|nr:hypothetical protein [Armatimonadota bacterium]